MTHQCHPVVLVHVEVSVALLLERSTMVDPTRKERWSLVELREGGSTRVRSVVCVL